MRPSASMRQSIYVYGLCSKIKLMMHVYWFFSRLVNWWKWNPETYYVHYKWWHACKVGCTQAFLFRTYAQKANPLQRRHNERHDESNQQQLNGLFNYLFKLTSRKTSKFALPVLCNGNPPVKDGFSSPRAGNAGSISITWRQNATRRCNFRCHNSY